MPDTPSPISDDDMIAALRLIYGRMAGTAADASLQWATDAELTAMRAILERLEASRWRSIAEAPAELRERASYMRGEAAAHRTRLCQYFDRETMTYYCWAVHLGPAAGDGVTHYFGHPVPTDCDLPATAKPTSPRRSAGNDDLSVLR